MSAAQHRRDAQFPLVHNPQPTVERTMEYVVLASISSPVTSERFVARWNRDTDSSSVASAAAREPQDGVYDGGLSILLAVIGGVASGVAANAIYDLVKSVFLEEYKTSTQREANPTPSPRVEVEVEEQESGLRLIRIRLLGEE